MKKIAVIIDLKTALEDFLRKNLETVFEDYVKITFYYLNTMDEGEIIEEDVVLVMTEDRGIKAQRFLGDNKSVIVIKRTVKEDALYPILKIPANTKVLVVNDTVETTLETVSLLYQIGIEHLNLIPFEANCDYEDINIAITPNVKRKVPEIIKNVIDIGNRHIDITSFIQIIDKLRLTDKIVTRNLIDYSDSIITLESGIKRQIRELYVKNEQLDVVVNLSNEGIVLTDNENKILVSNDAFLKIFGIKMEVVGKFLDELFDSETMDVIKKEELDEELINNNQRYIIINKIRTQYLGENYGYYYNFQEVTYIKTLEQNLRKKLKIKGFVTRYSFESIKTNSKAMTECVELAKRISSSDLTVFISGESGTGKEMLAQSIHNKSRRGNQPFIAVNCAAFAESLLESELFGYEGGAFTGALKEGKAGMFELADNGTIFLDEIGDMPLSLQTRLLRVLQEKQVMRVGSQRVIAINTRVIVATNKNLKEMVKRGEFREDLYYRINVLPICVPPLRQRREDIIPLLEYFLTKDNDIKLSTEIKEFLLNYNWPGNIRELENVTSYFSLVTNKTIEISDLPYYLFENDLEFQPEFSVVNDLIGLERCYEIMVNINDINNLGQGIGRQKLESLLKVTNMDISEGEIRRILVVLNQLDFVVSNKGRKGSFITKKGKSFLEWANKKVN